MEASARLFNSSNRHFSNSLLLKTLPLNSSPKVPHHSPFPFPPRSRHIPPPPLSIFPYNRRHGHTIQSNPRCYTSIYSSFPHSSNPPPSNSSPLGFFHTSDSSLSIDRFARIVSGSEDKSFDWSFALDDGVHGGDIGFPADKGPIVTVVLLGWLGSERKHLRRYSELYNSRGINSVTFVASVKDVLSLDLGRRLQERISALALELASWLSETEKDGRERFLLFHTFSNTGWLAYGAILADLQGRADLLEKIKGCIFDSGADPDLNPKVWAAGFTTALLKKNSSSAYSSVESEEGNELESGATVSNVRGKEPPLIEAFVLLGFEKLFSFLFNLPDINQRLRKVISVLSKNQPPCPQLYLYSTGDKVIPFRSVESFIEGQRKMGRKVWSCNFGSSPHVDHYRTFPIMYASQLFSFLKECLAMVKQM